MQVTSRLQTRHWLLLTFSIILGVTSGFTFAADGRQKTKPDNSAVNSRETSAKELNAEDQGGSNADVETTRKIRQAITDKSSLSTYAHNIKIITVNGAVTLKGPVANEAERAEVLSLRLKLQGLITSEMKLRFRNRTGTETIHHKS